MVGVGLGEQRSGLGLEQQRLDLIANLLRTQLLEEPGEEVARVIDQDIKSAELCDGGFDCCLRILWAGDVEAGSRLPSLDRRR